jgi:hypothetical protein
VLHIGSTKTGSSSIQYFLRDNRERLAGLGLLFPESPGKARHTRLSLYAKSEPELENSVEWYRQKQSDPVAFRRAFRRRLFTEIEGSGLSRVLFSDEALFACSKEALQRLSGLTDEIAGQLCVVVYLRRQDDHLVSRYQQRVKVGEIRRLTEWASAPDLPDTYDYYRQLRAWERLLEPNEFVVRRFERTHFVDGSLFQDFFDAAGIDARAEDMVQGSSRNFSLDAETVEFLRVFNLYRVENESAEVGLMDNRRLVRQLAERSAGPVLTLPSAFLDRFMAQWEEANRAVARRYLRDDTEELFQIPRKTDDTTTEQHLAPDRLDHFITLLELPDQVHAPLRRVAERAAKGD